MLLFQAKKLKQKSIRQAGFSFELLFFLIYLKNNNIITLLTLLTKLTLPTLLTYITYNTITCTATQMSS